MRIYLYLATAVTLFTTGIACMIYEVALLREFTLLLGSSIYSGAVVLSSVMAGLALGSLFLGKLSDRVPWKLHLLFSIEVTIALIALVLIPLTRSLHGSEDWIITDIIFFLFEILKIEFSFWYILLFYSAVLIFIPMFFMGGEIPIVIDILSTGRERDSKLKGVGMGGISGFSYFFDTAGGIIGALSAGLFLIPMIGEIRTVHLGGSMNTIGALSIALLILFLPWMSDRRLSRWKHVRFAGRAAAVFIVILVGSLLVYGYVETERREYISYGGLFEGQLILVNTNSEYQRITIVDHDLLGKVLFLNGREQISEMDHQPYSEALVMPAVMTLLTNRNGPIKVLLVGGGDLGPVEVLSRFHEEQISEIVHVDIDAMLVEVVKENLVSIHNDSWKDPRYHFVNMDGRLFVEKAVKNGEHYDLIILDLPDPNSDVLSSFYTVEFYNRLFDLLTEDGIVVSQATQADWALGAEGFVIVSSTMKASNFPIVRMYAQYVPSFGKWGFGLISKRYDPLELDPTAVKGATADMAGPLHTYNELVHFSLFRHPPWLEVLLASSFEVNTQDRPIILREY